MHAVRSQITEGTAAQFNDAEKSPWTVPFLGSCEGEGRAFARQILANTRFVARVR